MLFGRTVGAVLLARTVGAVLLARTVGAVLLGRTVGAVLYLLYSYKYMYLMSHIRKPIIVYSAYYITWMCSIQTF